jgi:hypothetical protein
MLKVFKQQSWTGMTQKKIQKLSYLIIMAILLLMIALLFLIDSML